MAAAEEDVEVVDAEVVEPGTGLAVVDDPVTGERLTVREADDAVLARFQLSADEWLQDQRTQVAAAQNAVNAELLRRMDAELKWTRRAREEGSDVEFELKADSPTAGTEAYDVDKLEQLLGPFVEDGTLSRSAFEEVIKRTVAIKVSRHDTERLERFAESLGATVNTSKAAHLPAVKKLAKLEDPRLNDAIAAARVDPKAINRPDRKVKVSIKTKKKR